MKDWSARTAERNIAAEAMNWHRGQRIEKTAVPVTAGSGLKKDRLLCQGTVPEKKQGRQKRSRGKGAEQAETQPRKRSRARRKTGRQEWNSEI